jgi:hypothetical protein
VIDYMTQRYGDFVLYRPPLKASTVLLWLGPLLLVLLGAALLWRSLQASGPLRAIVVCKYTVPEIASAVSRKYGARVTRVTLTPRNPSLGWGDAWEQKVLMGFDQRVARGEKAETLEHHEIVAEPSGRFVRYMRALPMLPICSHCHGTADQVSESIRGQLAHDYPHDEARGMAVGQVRGAVSFKKPLAGATTAQPGAPRR